MSKFTVTSHGTKFEFDTESWLEAVVMAHAMQGIKIRLDRSSASLTKKEGSTDQDRLDCAIKVAKSIQSGEMPKSGGGGSRLSIEDRALKAALLVKLSFEKKETISEALERYTKAIAEGQGKDFEPEMVEKVQTALEGTKTYKNVIQAEKDKVEDRNTDDVSL
jgi:hypothetical protein